jgi:hypothetical protein
MSCSQKFFRAFTSSLVWGAVFAVVYILFIFGSLAFVNGDGRAPHAVIFAFSTMDIALHSLGIKETTGAIFPATVFWSAGFTSVVFACKFFAAVILESSIVRRT